MRISDWSSDVCPSDRVEQREGTARRLSAALLFPLHQVSRPGDDAGDHRRALPRHPEDAGRKGAGRLLRASRRSGPQEKALDVGTARLAEAAAARGHAAGGSAIAGPEKGHSATARSAFEE